MMKRIWAMPTFEVHGLVGGYSGPGVKTIVPPRAELKCSIRLVPKMKGEKVVKLIKAFVKKRHPDVRVEAGSSAPPYKGITAGPYVEAAKRSIQFAFGKTPVFVREGGTIGAVLSMEQILKCPIVFMGLSLPGPRLPRPERELRLGPGRRRHRGLREVLRGSRRALSILGGAASHPPDPPPLRRSESGFAASPCTSCQPSPPRLSTCLRRTRRAKRR